METNQKIIYGVYRRKSSDSEDRQILSLEDQRNELEQLIRRDGLTVGKWYDGESRTAYKRGRPVFAEMMEDLENGRINAILVWHINRIARNAFDGGFVITLMDEKKIVEIRSISSVFRNTSSDKFMLGIEFNVAKKSSDDTGDVVRRSQRSKLASGWMPGTAPLGYLNTKSAVRGSNTIVKDPERFPLLRKAWEYMLTGTYTPDQILDLLNNEWGFRTRAWKKKGSKPMSRSTIYRVLTNPFYAGLIDYQIGGRKKKKFTNMPTVPGKHDPMVTLDEYDKVQVLLGRQGKRRATRHEYAYNGMATCGECGGFISATYKEKVLKSTGELQRYTLYYCVRARKQPEACSQSSYTRVQSLEQEIEEQLVDMTIKPEFLNWCLQVLDECKDEETEVARAKSNAREKALETAKKRLDKLTDMCTDGLIDDDAFAEKSAAIRNEVARLEVETREINAEARDWKELTARTFELSCYAHEHFLKGGAQVRREILAAIGLNRRLFPDDFRFQAVDWLNPIKEKYPRIQARIDAFEPEKYGLPEWEKAAYAAFNPEVRSGRDLNPQPPA